MSDEERENYERMAEAAHRDWVEDEERRDLEERIATLSAQLTEAVEALKDTLHCLDAMWGDAKAQKPFMGELRVIERIRDNARAFLEKHGGADAKPHSE